MRELNVEKFFADYDEAVRIRDEKIAQKDAAIEAAKVEAEQVCAEHNYSDTVKEVLTAKVVAEKEAEFDVTAESTMVENFEKYIVIKEEVVEEPVAEEVAVETQEVVAENVVG